MLALGNTLGHAAIDGCIVYLEGCLGAGKTTFCRGVIQGLGCRGAVKSPTYTLVEPYVLEGVTVYHFDFYRLTDPEELEFMGIREYFLDEAICLVEWPDRGEGAVPPADLQLRIEVQENNGRTVFVSALSDRGRRILPSLQVASA